MRRTIPCALFWATAFTCLWGVACATPPTAESIAKAMVLAVRSASTNNLERLTATPPQEAAKLIAEWRPEISRLADEELDASVLLQIVLRQSNVYPSGKFDSSEARIQTARLKSLPKELVDECVQAIIGSTSRSPGKTEAVTYLLQNDRLWNGADFTKQGADGLIVRFKSLPTAAILDFAEVSGVDIGLAPFAIVRVDELFASDSFQGSQFDAAMPIAKKLFSEK